jgi:hypothetical protein
LLHATALPEVEVRVVPEVLAVFHHDEGHSRVSRSADWRFLYSWALANKRYFTRRAFSFFVATFCVPSAAKEQEGRAGFLFLLRTCVVCGSADLKCLLLFFVCWWMPVARRRELRARYQRVLTALRKLAAVVGHPIPRKATL